MSPKLSKSQIDRLGDRLLRGSDDESDLVLLDQFRESFGEAYETVVRTIRDQLKLELTGRELKTTMSIRNKLRREPRIKLSQMQDVAGCRIVVSNVLQQESVVASLCVLFSDSRIVDRRLKPSHGYRAMHVIPRVSGKKIEIQVRTSLQHRWALLSEKLSDDVDPNLKYGVGDAELQKYLLEESEASAEIEKREIAIAELMEKLWQAQQNLEEEKKKFGRRALLMGVLAKRKESQK